ncbi:hypothetical protein CHK_1015 [Christensenella hongkongensis]|uniref:Uncharacterized protein n=1 Tax=Christensenella hongkongensis TaxID=270498 RepID=A0A0M2NHA8_9FIRM|nr:hypothetical protein CHK_1015 [Christensenella hongkongensis]
MPTSVVWVPYCLKQLHGHRTLDFSNNIIPYFFVYGKIYLE